MHTHYINITSICTSSIYIYTVIIFQVKVEIAKLSSQNYINNLNKWMEAANDLLHAKSGSSKKPKYFSILKPIK